MSRTWTTGPQPFDRELEPPEDEPERDYWADADADRDAQMEPEEED